ncbi:unnamed protein product [Schistosoma intercalatum]|nr:unnamed protein product [Schistosoma intercalatum]CAH8587067.1 unnamed protein product [Schistosoma intercalatum]
MLTQSPVQETSLNYQHVNSTTKRQLSSFPISNQQSLPITHQEVAVTSNLIDIQQQNQSIPSKDRPLSDADLTLNKIKSPSGIPRLFSLNDSIANRLNNNNNNKSSNNNNNSSPNNSPNEQNDENHMSNGNACNTNNTTTNYTNTNTNNNHNSIYSNNISTDHATLQSNSSYPQKSLPTKYNTLSSPNGSGNQRVSRPRTINTIQPGNRQDRTMSEHPHKSVDTESDTSSVFSSSGPPRPISSKIGSFQNAKHKPGGGNVQIFNEKVIVNTVAGKCNSLANVKHKPGGGNLQIIDQKLDFSSNTQSKVRSFQNIKHVPGGGDKKIPVEKLDFKEKASPKVGSLANVKHNPTGGDVKIFNEHLPWLKYNKPNLPDSEKDRINKRSNNHSLNGTNVNDLMNTSMLSGSTGH